GREKARRATQDPERNAKIAAARRGVPRPPEAVEKVRRALQGRMISAETRRRMSEAHRRRGTRPPKAGRPWTAEEEALLGTMTDRDVGVRTGRSPATVYARRAELGIPSFRRHAPLTRPRPWAPAEEALLGTMPDPELARRLGRQPMSVFYRRRQLRIPAYRGPS